MLGLNHTGDVQVLREKINSAKDRMSETLNWLTRLQNSPVLDA